MYRSRAPPIIGGISGDVTDNPEEGDNSSSHEDLRIKAYEKLSEIFPDEVEKVLKILDKYSDETSIDILTQHMLDDVDEWGKKLTSVTDHNFYEKKKKS